jgi:hypothetical protein
MLMTPSVKYRGGPSAPPLVGTLPDPRLQDDDRRLPRSQRGARIRVGGAPEADQPRPQACALVPRRRTRGHRAGLGQEGPRPRRKPSGSSSGRPRRRICRASVAIAWRQPPATCASPMVRVRHLVEVALRGLVSRVPSGARRGREIELTVLRVELWMESGIRGRRRLSAVEFHSVWFPAWSPAWRR